MRPYILSETNLSEIHKTEFQLAVLPWGATEAHNYHLPYGTDNYETEAIAAEAARLAWESGTPCLVLPIVPYGVNTGQQDIPGTMNIYPSTQALLLNDILESLQSMGIEKILVLNGHGGNDFKQMLREAGSHFPDIFMLTANWFQSVEKKEFFENEGDHADEMESSLMLHLHPALVLPLEKAGDGNYKEFASDKLKENWTWSERKWTRVSKDSGIGDPRLANAEKGKDYFEAVCQQVADLVIEIAKIRGEDPYEEK